MFVDKVKQFSSEWFRGLTPVKIALIGLAGLSLTLSGCDKKALQDTPITPISSAIGNIAKYEGKWIAIEGDVKFNYTEAYIYTGYKATDRLCIKHRYHLTDSSSNSVEIIQEVDLRLPRSISLTRVNELASKGRWTNGSYKVAGRLQRYNNSPSHYISVR